MTHNEEFELTREVFRRFLAGLDEKQLFNIVSDVVVRIEYLRKLELLKETGISNN